MRDPYFGGGKHNFYPRSPCGERLLLHCHSPRSGHISIHALLAESDNSIYEIGDISMLFLSTLSLRRATSTTPPSAPIFAISIHALLAESDTQTQKTPHFTSYFYPRSPCGERHLWDAHRVKVYKFLSTLSLRRATDQGANNQPEQQISIHALLAESDRLRSLPS